jgi:microcin C transport system permease protein
MNPTRWQRFRSMRRALLSLWILGLLFVSSLFAEFLCNDQPVIAVHQGQIYVPAWFESAGSELGLADQGPVDWNALDSSGQIWSLRAPFAHGAYNADLSGEGEPPYAPSLSHPLGTDAMGRDLMARLLYGFRTSMLFALALTAVSVALGVVLGGLQGYKGGRWDLWGQRFSEIWGSLPFLFVIILCGAILGSSFGVLLGAAAAFQWLGVSYYCRSEFYRVKALPYVRTARTLGLRPGHVFWKEIAPNALTPVIALLPFQIIGGIGTLTALDFLGFGLQPPTPSWGELLAQGLQNLQAPWLTGFTVLALLGTLLLTAFIGEGLRKALDARSSAHSQS